MNNKSQKLLFIVINFSLMIFLFKKYENKSELKILQFIFFQEMIYVISYLILWKTTWLVFLKKKGDFLKFKEQPMQISYYNSSTLNKNCVNVLDSLIANNILGS